MGFKEHLLYLVLRPLEAFALHSRLVCSQHNAACQTTQATI